MIIWENQAQANTARFAEILLEVGLEFPLWDLCSMNHFYHLQSPGRQKGPLSI